MKKRSPERPQTFRASFLFRGGAVQKAVYKRQAKENLQEIVNYLHDPKKYEEIGASMPKGILLVGLRAPARPCWPRP